MRLAPRDGMRAFLATALLSAFMIALLWLFRWPVPEGNRDLVNFMLGQLSVFAAGGMTFYFGTTQSSREKTEAMARLATDEKLAGTPEDPVSTHEVGQGDLPRPRFGAEPPPQRGR